MKKTAFRRVFALLLAALMISLCVLPAAAATPSSTTTANATLAYTLRGLPLGRAVQNFYVGETYIYITQRLDAITYLSRLRIEGKEAFYMDRMTLNDCGHGQSLDFYRYNNEEYFYVGCKADSVDTSTASDYDWSLQIARLKYEPGANYTYTDLNRMSYMNYVGKNGTRLGTTYRVACAVNGGYTIFRVQTKEGSVTYAAYDTNKLNALLDASKSVDMRNATSICSFSFTQSGSNIIRPNGSFQGIDLSSKSSIYLSGGGEGETPQIARTNSSGSYLKLVKVGNVGTHEIEGVQTQNGRVYFLIVPSTVAAEKKEQQAIYYINESVFGINHTLTEVAGKAATCTEAGLTVGARCTTCSQYQDVQETIPAKGHSEATWPGYPATCTETGLTDSRYCTVCSLLLKAQETIPAKGHSEVVDAAVEATCTEDGLTEGKHCSVCNEVLTAQESVPAKGHTTVTVDALAPTCTTEGLTEGSYCSVCNEILTAQEIIPATGHTPEVIPGKPATCTASGLSDGEKCAVCGIVTVEQKMLPRLGHTEVIDAAVAPTCTETGLTEGKHCSACGKVIAAQSVLDALGHSYKYADNSDKTHTVTCENCDFTEIADCVFENGECICGATEVSAPIYDETIKFSHSLTLENDISINFIGQGSVLSSFDSFYLECTVPVYEGNEKVGTETVNIEPSFNGTNYEFTLLGITAKMMNDEIEATFRLTKDGQEYYSKTDVYSVAEYAYGKLDSTKASDTDELKAICANLLRYGALAQTQFGYRTDALVDATMTDAHKAYLTDLNTVEMVDYRKQLNDLATPAVPWKSTTLELGNKVIMCLIVNLANYSGDPAGLTMRLTYTDAKGQTVTVSRPPELYNVDAQTYAVSYDGLRATEMRTIVSAAIYNGETRVSKTVEYSIESYGARSSDAAMQTLCLAMLAYGDAANAFFSK